VHKRRQLLRLEAGDLLVFYAGLEPWPKQDIPRLFAIGWFEVNEAYSLTAQQIAADRTLQQRFGNTAHFLRDPPDPELALIGGDKQCSRFLERALPLGDGEDRLLPDLTAFGYRGSLRRAVGHWLHGPAVVALEDWLHRGPTSLIDDATRIFTVAAIKLHPASPGRRGDLAIDDARPAIGDWVFARDGGAFALARINARAETGEASASLFWYMRPLAPAMRDRIPVPDPRSLPEPGAAAARRLVSWVASRYRIGVHAA
jgi:hypothetical protein